MQRKGSVLILIRDNKKIMRNVALVKKVPDYKWRNEEDFAEDFTVHHPLQCPSSPTVLRRSIRETRVPERLIETMI